MKKTLFLLALLIATLAHATSLPVQLLNPAGSTTGQAVVSTGPTTPPVWGTVSGNATTLLGGTWAAPGAIGSTTPNSGAFTTLSATTPNPTFSYESGASGAVARSYAAKLGDIVSVRDFGAMGNGSTNDTAAVNAAITAACGTGSGNSIGGTVHFPPGAYVVTTGSVSITQSNCYLVGDGPISTIITASGTTGNLISFSATQFDGISGMYLDYAATPSSGAALAVSGAQANFIATNLSIFGAFQGINDSSSGAIHYYTNISIYNTVPTTGVGMSFSGFGNDDYLKNIVINAPAGSQPSIGILVSNNGGIWIDAVDIIHNNIGLLIGPQNSTDVVSWAFISNSAFDTNSSYGIELFTTNSSQVVKGVNFVDCWSSSNTDAGVLISGTAGVIDGVRFVAHRSFNNGQDGIDLLYGSDISINDSDFSGNSQTTSGTYQGIDVGAAISGLSITSSRSTVEAGFANTQNAGILINSTAQNNYQLIGNNVQANVHFTIDDLGTGTNKIIKGNSGYNPRSAVITPTGSPFTYTNNSGDTETVVIAGGAVSSVTLAGLGISSSTNLSVALPQNQSLVVTYTTAPTMAYYGY